MTRINTRSRKKNIIAAVLALALLGGGLVAATSLTGSAPEPSRPEATAQASPSGSDSENAPAEDSAQGSAAHSAPKSGLAAYDKNGDGVVYQGGMHPEIIQDEPGKCPICGMDLNPVRVDGQAEAGIVQIASTTIQNIGVRTAEVQVAPLSRTVRSTGRFKMDEEGMRSVSLKIGGWVETLHADYEGAIVKKGEPLLELYSPELVATQEEYLLALRNADRLGDTPEARRLLNAARRRLAYWDLSEAQIERLKETRKPRRTMTFYAPASGEVMHKSVTEGQRIEAGQTLMHIADISTVWLIADVYEQDLPWISVGTPARIKLVSDPGQTYRGRVDHIYHMMDTETRTAKARIELPGGHHTLLKPGAYATVYLEGRRAEPAPVVPEEAIVSSGERDVVVLALGEGRFRPVPVETGLQAGGHVQILSGLDGGERVVTSAQFLIDSEARLQGALEAMAGSEERDREPEQEELPTPGASQEATSSARPASLEENRAPASAALAVQDSVQVVRITVGAGGFEPQEIELEAGAPARLVFTRTTEETCAKKIYVPEFGIEKAALPLGEEVAVEFTPGKPGTYAFACGMDMLEGTLIVASS